jgi:hypothetical protein
VKDTPTSWKGSWVASEVDSRPGQQPIDTAKAVVELRPSFSSHVRLGRTWGTRLFLQFHRVGREGIVFVSGVCSRYGESGRWASPVIFVPHTLVRTWGTRRFPPTEAELEGTGQGKGKNRGILRTSAVVRVLG